MMDYLLGSRTTSLKAMGNLGLYPSCNKRQETLMLGIGNSNKNILKNKPTSSAKISTATCHIFIIFLTI